MNQNKQPEALRLADEPFWDDEHCAAAAAELRRLHAESEQHLQELRSYRITVENREARIAGLEAQLIAEAARTAEQKLRAEQLEQQHDMQAKMHAQAAEQLAAEQQSVEVTDDMALAFHQALTDGALGADDLNDIKTGLRAALSHVQPLQKTAAAQQGVKHGYVLEDDGHAGYLDGQVSRFSLRRADGEFLAWIVAAPHADDGEAIAQEIINALNATTAAAQGAPQSWKLVPEEPTPAMYERAMREGYYHDDPKTVKAVLRAEYQDMLAAAPQPPEVAPVQMHEEDAGWFKYDRVSRCWHPQYSEYAEKYAKLQGWQKLYTEHQVRQLLAAHGIK